MTSLEIEEMIEQEFWEDLPEFSPELTARMSELGNIASDLHTFLHGPGGDWNGKPDFYA